MQPESIMDSYHDEVRDRRRALEEDPPVPLSELVDADALADHRRARAAELQVQRSRRSRSVFA